MNIFQIYDFNSKSADEHNTLDRTRLNLFCLLDFYITYIAFNHSIEGKDLSTGNLEF